MWYLYLIIWVFKGVGVEFYLIYAKIHFFKLYYFYLLPNLGFHNYIGIDIITFSVDYPEIKLEKFEHILTHYLLANLSSLNNEIPVKYE
jgi:hypothetical protein